MRDAYFGLGVALTKMGNDDEALEKFERAQEYNPRNALAYSYMGAILHTQERYNLAIENYKKSIRIDASNI